jgi:hypothetical protein
MPQFQVPQFIEQEAKIVGPLSLRQFLYFAIAGGISFISFYIFNFFLWLIITVALLGAAVALAFVKIHGQSMATILGSAFSYLLKARIYTWQRSLPQKTLEISDLEELNLRRKNMSIQEKLKSVALDITAGKLFSPKGARKEKPKYQPVVFITGERRLAKRVDFPSEK